MKSHLQLALFVCGLFLVSASQSLQQLANLTWGTGGFGFGAGSQLPGVQVPYGALRLGPDTSALIQLPFQHYGGYAFDDSHISAFSHTHLVGAGVADFGNFGVMVTDKGAACITEDCYKSSFSHATETASPGLYSVYLEDPAVKATLAATGTHSGMHRYAATQGSATNGSTLLLDVCHNAMADVAKACAFASLAVTCGVSSPAAGNASCTVAELTGTVHMIGSLSRRANEGYLPIFIHARVEATTEGGVVPLAVGGWKASTLIPSSQLLSPAGVNTTSGSLGATLQAATGSAVQWQVRVGISFVSQQLAAANLAADQCSGGLDFNACVTFEEASAASVASWGDHFSKLDTPLPSGDTPLYSWQLLAAAWYRTAQAPTVYSESNGQYPAFAASGGGAVGTVPSGVRAMSDMSLWDIHRTQAPLMTLTDQRAALDAAWSLANAWRTGGKLPVWPLANAYTGCMIGSHGVPLLADVAVKLGCPAMEAHGLPCSVAFAAANSSVLDKALAQGMITYGYVPQEQSKEGASHTLALSYDAAAAAALGRAAGVDAAGLQPLQLLAGAFKNVWSHDATRMCPRLVNGSFECGDPNIPYPFENGFTEGDGNQWSWFVPGDIDTLVQLWGGSDAAASNLSEIMQGTPGWVAGNVLPNPFYWAGNEPDLLQIWLFNWMVKQAPGGVRGGSSGQCYPHAPQAQFWVQWALRSGQAYSTQPSGIPGNDDYGTMAAWVAWASLGVYPVTGSSLYTLGSPQLPKATLALSTGKTLTVIAHNWTDVTFPDAKGRVSPQPPGKASDGLAQELRQCATAAAAAEQPSTAHATCTMLYLQKLSSSASLASHVDAARPLLVGNAYVQSAAWNGQALTKPFLEHSQLEQGGTLEFVMGPEPAPAAFCVESV